MDKKIKLNLSDEKAVFPNGFEKKRLECKVLQEVASKQGIEVPKFKTADDVIKYIGDENNKTEDIRNLFSSAMNELEYEYIDEELNTRFKSRNKCKIFLEAVFNLFPSGGGESTDYKQSESTSSPTSELKPVIPVTTVKKCIDVLILPTCKDIEYIMDYGSETILSGIDCMQLDITEGLPVEIQDKVGIRLPSGDISLECIALIDKSEKHCLAVGRLENNGTDNCFVFNSEYINYDKIQEKERYSIMLFSTAAIEELRSANNYKQEVQYYISDNFITVKYKNLKVDDHVLCIDFGTSNTAVGSYGILPQNKYGEIQLVEFIDVTDKGNMPKGKNLLPTIIYVNSCKKGSPVEFKFGYEAKLELIEHDFLPNGSVFYEIKRWINTLDKEESIHDAEGNTAIIKRSEIVKAYIQYVIDCAQRYFKVKFKHLHFSAPTKLKDLFLQAVTDMFKDKYKVRPVNDSLDEGVAIVYDKIKSDIKSNRKERIGEESSILIIDCGGGTTDVASCKYTLIDDAKTGLGDQLKITTSFVSGDSNFGGNNITYRIMQMLKIKIASKFNTAIQSDIGTLIGKSGNEILNLIDKQFKENKIGNVGSKKECIYSDFEEAYNLSENIIPTKYNDYNFDGDKRKVKRNFDYLWEIADKLKIEFHKTTQAMNGRAFMNFDNNDREVCIEDQKQYYLYRNVDNKLEKIEAPLSSITTTINDISHAIYGDLYTLLNTVLPIGKDGDDIAEKYDATKLTGQSCHINLFYALLKEFIPGRNMRNISDAAIAGDERFKLPCVKGCIEYIMDINKGRLAAPISHEEGELRHTVKNDDTDEIMLSPGVLKVKKTHYNATEMRFIIYDSKNEKVNEKEYEFKFSKKNTEKVDLATIMERVRKNSSNVFSSEMLDECIRNELHGFDMKKVSFPDPNMPFVKFVFALPAKGNNGMNVFFIVINDKHEYFWSNQRYIAFEDENLECFFNGKR